MATLATIANISQVAGVFASPVLQAALDQLLRYLSGEPSVFSLLGQEPQLRDDLEELQDAMESATSSILVAEDLQRHDESVLRFLMRLKDALHDAEDLIDELDYYELELRVKRTNTLEAANGEPSTDRQSIGDSLLSRAKETMTSSWSKFAQNITSRAGDTANQMASGSSSNSSPATAADATTNQESSSSSSSSFSSTFSSRIKVITENLNRLTERLDKSNLNASRRQTKYHDPMKQRVDQNNRRTTSFVDVHKICGREEEQDRLVKMLLQSDSSSEFISVYPIIGMGGIGKTTLAQWVYNNESVKEAFETRAWVCVSDVYNREKIAREILEQISEDKAKDYASLNKLEGKIVENLTDGKNFLLVLDDLWSHHWTELLDILKSAETKCIRIVATSRDRRTLNRLGEKNIIDLKPLEKDIYWSLFLRCIFGDEDPDNHLRLHSIGREIAKKLKGSPLAARTVGRLLRLRLDDEHWDSVLRSNLWELPTTDPNDIMPALALSYSHLSKNLQQCFAFCSVYPKDFEFEKKNLISMWIAQGYVQGKTNLILEEVGEQYFEELLSRSFFGEYFLHFKMHDLLHDLAQSVSLGECCIYDGRKMNKDSRVRHLCINTHTRVDLSSACDPSKLRTLILLNGRLDAHEIQASKRLRALILRNKVHELPDTSGGTSKHLRCVDLSGTDIKEYPKSWCELYHLRALFLPHDVSMPMVPKLINLRRLQPIPGNSGIPGIGSMTCLEELREFLIEKECGYEITQLKSMNALGGDLLIWNLENVESRGEASETNLKDKSRLQGLGLCWGNNPSAVEMCNANPDADVAEEVLEGLQPHANLKVLWIVRYSGSTSPNWLSSLQNLRRIDLLACQNWARLPPLGQLPFLHTLSIEGMQVSMDGSGDDANVVFPSLGQLSLTLFSSFTLVGVPASTTQGRCFFPRLRKLKIWALEEQSSGRVHNNDFQLPSCIHAFSAALQGLKIQRAATPCFPGAMIDDFQSLERLEISNCQELRSVGGLQALTSLRELAISSCSIFSSWLTEGPAQGCFLPNLRSLEIFDCESLASLPAWLSHLPSLETLKAFYCPKLRSLPDGGLPRSLRVLTLSFCDPGFIVRCKEDGSPEWQMIHHVPSKIICPGKHLLTALQTVYIKHEKLPQSGCRF